VPETETWRDPANSRDAEKPEVRDNERDFVIRPVLEKPKEPLKSRDRFKFEPESENIPESSNIRDATKLFVRPSIELLAAARELENLRLSSHPLEASKSLVELYSSDFAKLCVLSNAFERTKTFVLLNECVGLNKNVA
jgi:hypothetical protein